MKVFVTGGVRSGKSRYAQTRTEALATTRVYLATAQAHDDEMRVRIDKHRADRGPSWRTIEAPLDVAKHLTADDVVLLDCLTLWLSNLMMLHDDDDAAIEAAFAELEAAVVAAPNHVVVVTNEVGFGIVPPTPMGRRFRDLTGILSQRIARACDEAVLVCAGIPLRMK